MKKLRKLKRIAEQLLAAIELQNKRFIQRRLNQLIALNGELDDKELSEVIGAEISKIQKNLKEHKKCMLYSGVIVKLIDSHIKERESKEYELDLSGEIKSKKDPRRPFYAKLEYKHPYKKDFHYTGYDIGFEFFDKDDKYIGGVDLNVHTDEKIVFMYSSEVKEPRKGYGQAIYKKIGESAAKLGFEFISSDDLSNTDEKYGIGAVGLWEALVRDGFAEKLPSGRYKYIK